MSSLINKYLIIFGLVLLILNPITVIGQNEISYFYTSGQAKITTPDLVVKVTSDGNVPQYFFWASETSEESTTEPISTQSENTTTQSYNGNFLLAQNNESEDTDTTEHDNEENGNGNGKTYFVKFLTMFEFEDKNNNGNFDQGDKKDAQSTVNFPRETWSFSDFEVEKSSDNSVTTVHFNFTHNGDPAIQFRNHVNADKSNQLKFDIIIQNYDWQSTDHKLAIKILVSGGGLSQSENNRYKFGDAFFGHTATAQGSDKTVNVTSSIEGGNSLYLVYEHFGANLNHDPEIGLSESSDNVSLEPLIIISGLMTVSTYLIVIRRRRN
ncbi:MAG: hypothetical protein ACXAC7_11050 [Candidatus Hodarchaeales archaeon]|jgi:hypothetical protein